MMEVLFATSNKNKVSEANEAGRKYGIVFTQIHVLYQEIRSDSVAEVAKAGAEYVYSEIQKPVIVEDSGIFINALNDFPGAYSRFVFEKLGNDGILKLLAGVEDREARFVSAVGYIGPAENKIKSFVSHSGISNTQTMIFEGVVEGKITTEKLGARGFGYDPIFKPKGYVKTFAEDVKMKNTISHRKIAFEKLCEWLKNKA